MNFYEKSLHSIFFLIFRNLKKSNFFSFFLFFIIFFFYFTFKANYGITEECSQLSKLKDAVEEIKDVVDRIEEEIELVSDGDIEHIKSAKESSEAAIDKIECSTEESDAATGLRLKPPPPESLTVGSQIEIINETRRASYKVLNKICNKYKGRAHACCSNTSKCVFSDIEEEVPGLNPTMITGVISALSQGIASSGDQSLALKMCKVMRTVSFATSGINAVLSGFCFSKIESCVSVCDPGEKYEDFDERVESDSSAYQIKRLKQSTASCRGLRVAGGMLVAQSAIIGALGAFFQYCTNTTEEEGGDNDSNPDTEYEKELLQYWKTLCSNQPDNLSCSKCLKNNRVNLNDFECTNPSDFSSSNPDTPGTNVNSSTQDPSDNKKFSIFDKDDDLYDGNQDSSSLINPQQFHPNAVQDTGGFSGGSPQGGGGGGGLGGFPGGGGSSSGGRSNKKKKSNKDKEHNTDILQGFRKGGSGGSLVDVPFSKSGSKGGNSYSNRSPYRRRNSSKKGKLDLKDFLPGGKKDQKKKEKEKIKFSSLSKNRLRKVRRRRDDLFLINSKKIYQICVMKKLKNCNLRN